jgi:type I restriction enzyme S subunit
MTSSTLWKEIEIGEIAKFSSGTTRPSNTVKEYSNEFNIPVYGGNGILGYSNEYIFEKPQLIIGRVGEYCGCVHITKEKSWITDNALYMKEYSPENDLIFLKYCFQYLNLNKYSNKMGQPLITQSIISK